MKLFPGDDGLVHSAEIRRGDGSVRVHSLKYLYPLELHAVRELETTDAEPSHEEWNPEDGNPWLDDGIEESNVGENRSQTWICPGCNHPDDGSAMICCDQCNHWYHFRCVGIRDPPLEDEWFCNGCLNH